VIAVHEGFDHNVGPSKASSMRLKQTGKAGFSISYSFLSLSLSIVVLVRRTFTVIEGFQCLFLVSTLLAEPLPSHAVVAWGLCVIDIAGLLKLVRVRIAQTSMVSSAGGADRENLEVVVQTMLRELTCHIYSLQSGSKVILALSVGGESGALLATGGADTAIRIWDSRDSSKQCKFGQRSRNPVDQACPSLCSKFCVCCRRKPAVLHEAPMSGSLQ
jgi:hypothetical protein